MRKPLSPEQREKNRIRSAKWAEANRDVARERAKLWYEQNRERAAETRKAYYAEKGDQLREKYRKRYDANKERILAARAALPSDHPVKAAARARVAAWVAQDPERKREADRRDRAKHYDARIAAARKYRVENPDKTRAQSANKKAGKALRTPKWLTADHKRQIAAMYAEAVIRSAETGTEWHVDHIVPLRGRIVCGLHVPWNLQVIPGAENMRKHNRFAWGEA